MNPSKWPLYLLLILGLLAILVASTQAKTESINVEPGKDASRATPNMAAGDRFSISLTVVGPAPSTVHFFIVLANGTTVDYGNVSHCNVNFFTPSGPSSPATYCATSSPSAEMNI